MSETLKPCPNPWCKCHSRDFPLTRIGLREVRNHERMEYACYCIDCHIQSPPAPNKMDAFTAWNTRKENRSDT